MRDAQTEARAIERLNPETDVAGEYLGMWPAADGFYVSYEDHATAIAAKDAELARLREFERQHDYCCCGDRIDEHNIGSGHAPVSVFDYEYRRSVERAERAEAQLAEANKALDQIAAIEPQSNCDAGSMARSRMRDIARLYIARRAREQGGE